VWRHLLYHDKTAIDFGDVSGLGNPAPDSWSLQAAMNAARFASFSEENISTRITRFLPAGEMHPGTMR
jgi:hypothetical protein